MNLYITDKTGAKFFRVDVSAQFSIGERRNLQRHLNNIKAGKRGYEFVDAATAEMVGGEAEMSADDILAALTA